MWALRGSVSWQVSWLVAPLVLVRLLRNLVLRVLSGVCGFPSFVHFGVFRCVVGLMASILCPSWRRVGDVLAAPFW